AGILMLFTPWPGPLASLVVVPYLVNAYPYLSVSDAEAHRTNTAWRRFIWLNYIAGFLVTLILIAAWTQAS
ncbi:MAG TPA: prenyltransferase, partial [Terrimesophilobacter sp.]|nr:prenyltransferase [Terrimesophilobacter sp.]